jgi:hypothetical protein
VIGREERRDEESSCDELLEWKMCMEKEGRKKGFP